MTSKTIIKVKDCNCNHEPSFLRDSEFIQYIRNLSPYSNGDVLVENDDIVVYTDFFQKHIDSKAKYNIALLLESQEIHGVCYDYIAHNNHKFDLVLTFDKTLLDMGKNFTLNLYGTCWLHDSYISLWPKYKLCSMVTSNKTATSGHRFRHVITDYITKTNYEINIYGGNYLTLPYMTTTAFTTEHSSRHITNCKINALKDYMFSISIENTKQDYYFTEKLIDCFLTGTVPIYYGCPSIYKFFNIKGIIVIDTLTDLINILPTITTDLYNNMKPYIEENYNTAQKYKTFKINEPALLDLINKTG
jgi:hypothetical protein